jgi:hypothetical protein
VHHVGKLCLTVCAEEAVECDGRQGEQGHIRVRVRVSFYVAVEMFVWVCM